MMNHSHTYETVAQFSVTIPFILWCVTVCGFGAYSVWSLNRGKRYDVSPV